MKHLSIVLSTILILNLCIQAQDESRVYATWQVQKYDITATLPSAETNQSLTAKAILSLKNVSSRPAQTLTLRISPNAEVSVVKVSDAAVDFTKGEEKIDASRSLQRIVVRVPAVQPNATFTVAVDYKLNIRENTGLNALSPIGSQLLPLSFWYPTPNSWFFARGADFAPMRLQINAASNASMIASGTQTGGAFEQKSNGQPFFISGDWDTVNANGVAVFAQKGADAEAQKRANEIALLALEAKTFTANLLGAAPDSPLRIVAVKRGAGFSSGGTVFIDESALRRQKIDSQTAMIIAESIVKLWIGNSVTVNGDGFGVIREGLPRYIATQFIEKQYGKDIADIERLRQRTSYASIVKRDAPLNIVSPLDDYYFAAVTNKGAMIWRLLAKNVGQDEFFNVLRAQINDGNTNLSELRSAFSIQKEFLDYSLDQVTETNLLVGLPQVNGAETKIALRNLGAIDATVNVVANTASGEKLIAQSTVPAKKFGEVIFKTSNKIVRTEIDTDKFYPQTDYSDDVAPSEFKESDVISAIKRAFDQQDFIKAEKNARSVLQFAPRFDDARIWLARSLLAQNKNTDAEKEFRAVLSENLPTARSLAWANVGLGEIALKSNQNSAAVNFFAETLRANAEYGATLAARAGLDKSGAAAGVDESIKTFFAQFDKAAISGRKADVDALIVAGEMTKFSGGISGQAQEWTTRVIRADKLDTNNALVEVNLNVKLLNKNAESGTAVFLLSKIGGGWKLSGVEIFEVR